MNYNDIFPFTRPNYYKGKQLTFRDFREEQGYHEGKLRAVRSGISGCGAVSGLDVVAVDERSYSLEAGYAVDSAGRDIAVSAPVLRDIAATEGYDDISFTDDVYLCIEYAETPLDRTAPVCDSGREEYDRVREGYRLYLTNERPADGLCGLCRLSETVVELYRTEQLTVSMAVPKYVGVDECLIVTLTVEKRGLDKALSVALELSSDDFSEGNTAEYYNATDTCDFWQGRITLPPKRRSAGTGIVSAAAEAINIVVGDERVTGIKGAAAMFELIDGRVSDRLRSEFFHADPARLYGDDPIYLAQLYLTGSREAPYIGLVRQLPFDQYIMSPQLAFLTERVPVQPAARQQGGSAEVRREQTSDKRKNLVSSGVESIDITNDLRGRVYYSQEIVHGLGEGNISYTVGFECTDSFVGENDAVIYGDPELFEGSPYGMDFPKLQYSIISYSSKGTFRIAVKLLDKVNAGSIRLHWQAVLSEEKTAEDMMEVEKVSISIKPNLVNIEPRGTVSLECVIEGSDNMNCIWNVEDKNGGTISRNGIYKAPSSEGVYTVTATSVKYPTKKAVNYIIVSKRKEL